jgi:large subunit ribosomal protein L15
MKLNELFNESCPSKSRKRLGRGIGSGLGKTSGKGHKGQKARSGVAINGFEGGQQPIHRRLPKRGFNSIARTEYQPVNFLALQRAVDAGRLDAKKKVDVDALLAAGIIRNKNNPVKLLAKGTLKVSLDLEVNGASQTSISLVEKAGGKVAVVAPAKKQKKAA